MIGLNGYRIPAVQLLEDLNEIAGNQRRIGRADCIENRIVGMKSFEASTKLRAGR